MKTIKIIVMVVLTIVLATSVYAVQVKGLVQDATTKSPIDRVKVSVLGKAAQTITDVNGEFSIEALVDDVLYFEKSNFSIKKVKVGKSLYVKVLLHSKLIEVEQSIESIEEELSLDLDVAVPQIRMGKVRRTIQSSQQYGYPENTQNWNTEEYSTIHENGYKNPMDDPLSTFSIDVDAASYSNMRRYLNIGQLPPKDAIRVEELINYFNYDYSEPKLNEAFSINTEVATAAWNTAHQLVQIGIQGKHISIDRLPSSNLVFLLDVSGSMNNANKLPLLKSALKLLVGELREGDIVSIVVYAGAAGLVLPPTDGENKQTIIKALDKLSAGGSTAGGAGIKLAYTTAREQFIEGGNNRIILATDGDFNIGASSNAEMERLIEQERKSGVFLTVLGFGMGNYKDSKMEILADKGNGNYAYIDNLLEAKKVLITEFGGTLFTIAKDVKIQVEFNPKLVQSYRLIGYENRLLNKEDFNDDKKDAGELGSGHTVTAMYEIVPVGVAFKGHDVDPLKYQTTKPSTTNYGSELMTVKVRYKGPEGVKSRLISHEVHNVDKSWMQASTNFKWATAVAEFGMILKGSEYVELNSYEQVLKLANSTKGKDEFGYRMEFIRLVESASLLTRN